MTVQKNYTSTLFLDKNERLKLLRNMAGFTMKELAKKTGFGASTINHWESNKDTLSERGAKRLLEVFRENGIECSAAWLLHGAGDPPQFLTVSLSKETRVINVNLENIIRQAIDYFHYAIENSITTSLNTDALYPVFRKGFKVGGQKIFNSFEKYTKLPAIISTQNEEIKVGIFQYSISTRSFVVETIQGDIMYESSTPPKYIAPITWCWCSDINFYARILPE
jgi:transcriptional regulator with XRE-family HTH domain